MIDHLAKFRISFLVVVLAAVIGLLSLLSWKTVFKAPISQYMQLKEEHALFELTQYDPSAMNNEIRLLSNSINQLQKEMFGETHNIPPRQMTAHIIAQLDQLSSRHNVKLKGIKPLERSKILMFEQLPFDIEVTGRYLDLYHWLNDIDEKLGPLAVTQFTINTASKGRDLNLRLKLASYKVVE